MAIKQVNGPAGLLHVDDVGIDGVPVIFVHSFAGDTTHWAAQLDHLRKTRRALAFDLRGHGQSHAPMNHDFSVASLAEDIAAVVDELDVERFVLVGHSLGAAASLIYAGQHPQRVAGLLLVGIPGKVPAKQAQQIISALESNFDKTMEDYLSQRLALAQANVLEKLREGRQKLSPDSAVNIIKALFEYEPLPALANYHGQILLVSSPTDEDPNALHHLAPDVPHIVVEGTSHWLHLDRPEEFNGILDEFLSAVEGQSKAASKP
jgi:pimeloyl-ACP methyl ester carboxylesterase